jgi:hypothetical protein
MSSTVKYPNHPGLDLPYYVDVCESHIQAGLRSDEDSCPIALALTQAGFANVKVGNWQTEMLGQAFSNHSSVACFVEMFDELNPVSVGTLQIDYEKLMLSFLD